MLKKYPYIFAASFCLLFLLSFKSTTDKLIDVPILIKAGTAKITGSITSLGNANKNNIYVDIIAPQPISGEKARYKTLVDQYGKFSIDIDVETQISLIILKTSFDEERPLFVKLTSGGVTNINIVYNLNDEIHNIELIPATNKNDVTLGFEVLDKMLRYQPSRAPEPLYNKSTVYYLNYFKEVLSERLAVVDNDTLLSEEFKKMLSKDFKLFAYRGSPFDYAEAMRINYRNINPNESKQPDIQKIDRSYFGFLKDFKLNDPQYLQCPTFLEFQSRILQNEVLDLPEIGESEISSWLAKVKAILSDLVGFNNGPYYDILAANAYARQLNEEVRPLTDKQKENIEKYWKNGEIAKILLRKNQKIAELGEFKLPVVINEISSVSDDKVIETILSKYKNKVVLIDLWATWCVPCLNAMEQFRSTKNEFKNKNVTFVYLTNVSSPKKLWEEKIKGIGSEHYYLKDSQWGHIMNHFGFEAIPSYLLYNKEGVLINKFTAFPGNEKMKEMINGLL
ncbi:TlpA family protein disulfide reductase [Pedobacter montanisoli]|uniref:TlpA family protein disulfide reductase n=1 Tax=Pedobacter montanisoli TaxID=2923277 RepID=A0ABS9ZXU0_9SPHI|nr:TlpA family protein disulfide reductase [Pedobacter montanisoli]MCJ0743133.1 TlpA family protein disulfide reductase [Pedobacter montanisoli]